MTPGIKRQAWKSLKRFPHLQSNDDELSFEIPVSQHLLIPIGMTPAWRSFAAIAMRTWQGLR